MSGEATTVSLLSPTGQRLMALASGGVPAVGASSVPTFVSLDYTNVINGVGRAALTVREGVIPSSWIQPEYQLEITRSTDPALPEQIEGECRWFIDGQRHQVSAGLRTLLAGSSLGLLRTRDVPYAETTSEALKAGTADDLIKAYVRENLGSSATDTARRLSASLFQVATDLGLGPSLTYQAADKNLLQVCQQIAAAAAQQGTAVFFDIVWTGSIFELRTYLGQRGTDRSVGSGNDLLIEADVLGDVEIGADYSQEATYVRAGDQSAQNDTQIARSPYALKEATISARGSDSASQLAEARRGLWERRARTTFSATMTSSNRLRYGIDWGWGDRLTVTIGGESWPVRVDSRTVKIQGSRETVTAQLRVEV